MSTAHLMGIETRLWMRSTGDACSTTTLVWIPSVKKQLLSTAFSKVQKNVGANLSTWMQMLCHSCHYCPGMFLRYLKRKKTSEVQRPCTYEHTYVAPAGVSARGRIKDSWRSPSPSSDDSMEPSLAPSFSPCLFPAFFFIFSKDRINKL